MVSLLNLPAANRLTPRVIASPPANDSSGIEKDKAKELRVSEAYGKLPLRRGVFEAPYRGDVYVIDAISNNPGAAGGALTTRKGELIALIGKELQNSLTDTWINYAVPLQATVCVRYQFGVKTE